MAVAFEEIEGSPTFSFGFTTSSAKRIVKIAWADIPYYVEEQFPRGVNQGGVNIHFPRAKFPGIDWLVTESLDVEPFDPSRPLGLGEVPCQYPEGARVTQNYQNKKFEEDEGNQNNEDEPDLPKNTFLTYKIGMSGQWVTSQARSCEWLLEYKGSRAVSDDVQVGVVIGMTEHQLTWHQVAKPPWNAIRKAIGRINRNTFLGAPAETLLFLGANATREWVSGEVKMWELEYRFMEKRQGPDDRGWNWFLRPDSGKFEKLITKDGFDIYTVEPTTPGIDGTFAALFK